LWNGGDVPLEVVEEGCKVEVSVLTGETAESWIGGVGKRRRQDRGLGKQRAG
jgi:hypothetical protein